MNLNFRRLKNMKGKNYVLIKNRKKKRIDFISLKNKLTGKASTGRLTAKRKKDILARLKKKKMYQNYKNFPSSCIKIVKGKNTTDAIDKGFPNLPKEYRS